MCFQRIIHPRHSSLIALLLLTGLTLQPSFLLAQELESRRPTDPAITKADQLFKSGQGDAAEALLDAYVSMQPKAKQPAALIRLADIAMRRWDFQDAQKHLETALRIEPNNVDALAELGRLYYEQSITPINPIDRLAKSGEYFDQALNLNPNHAKTLAYLGLLELERTDFVSAERHFKQALQLNNQLITAFQGQTRFYLRTKDFVRAREAITHALELDPNNSSSYFLTAQLLAVADHPAEAVKYAQKSEALDFGRDLNRDYFLATQLEKLGDAKKALAYHQKMLQDYPNRADSWLRVAELHISMRQPEKSINAYQRAIAIDPTIWQTVLNQARQLTRQDSYMGAITQWQKVQAIAASPQEKNDINGLLDNLVYAQMLTGIQPGMNLPAGNPIKNSVAQQNPLPGNLPPLLTSQLMTLASDPSTLTQTEAAFLAGNFEKAKTLSDTLDGLPADAYQLAGDRLYLLKNYRNARIFYQRALELLLQESPESAGLLKEVIKRIDSKEKMAQRLIEDGNLLFDAKKYAAAAQQYEQAARLFPESEMTYLRLGDTYERMKSKELGDKSLIGWAYRQATKANPSLMDSKGFAKKYTAVSKKAAQ